MPPGEYHTYSSARLQRKYPISLSQSHKVVPAGPVSRQFINVFQDKLYVSLLLPSMEAPVRGCVLEQRVFLKALRVLVERGKSTTFKSVKAQVVDAFPSNLAVCIRRDASLVSLELHMRPREKKNTLFRRLDFIGQLAFNPIQGVGICSIQPYWQGPQPVSDRFGRSPPLQRFNAQTCEEEPEKLLAIARYRTHSHSKLTSCLLPA